MVDSIAFASFLGVDEDLITPDRVRQIVYQLDMYDRYSDVRSRYLDPQNIKLLRAGLRAAVVRRYDTLTQLNYFDSETQKFPLASPTSAQKSILHFFNYLRHCADGSTDFCEGIKYHFVTTNYDYIIETILDNVNNDPSDLLFLYTYRGFSPTRISSFRNPVITHLHALTQHLIKINGGFEILRDGDNYYLDYNNRTQIQITDQPPIIMLPSREQDYTNSYFRTIFPKVVRLMRDTKVLVLVGYSLPDDDALIRFILRQFAEEPEDARQKAIFYIDPMNRRKKLTKLESIYPSIDTLEVPRVETFEGTFDKFAAECVSLDKTTQRFG